MYQAMNEDVPVVTALLLVSNFGRSRRLDTLTEVLTAKINPLNLWTGR